MFHNILHFIAYYPTLTQLGAKDLYSQEDAFFVCVTVKKKTTKKYYILYKVLLIGAHFCYIFGLKFGFYLLPH